MVEVCFKKSIPVLEMTSMYDDLNEEFSTIRLSVSAARQCPDASAIMFKIL